MQIDAVDLFFVRIHSDGGGVGIGSASPAEDVTGESPEACERALREDATGWLKGRDPEQLDALCSELARTHVNHPAARAAVDMALHDLAAHSRAVPLVDLLGRCHEALPTSVTIGISPVEETISEAEEYIAAGFRILKVKTGQSFEEDAERLRKLRERVGPDVAIRIDGNQGCTVDETLRLGDLARSLHIELIEQPLPAESFDEMRSLPAPLRRIVAADESLKNETDARILAGDPSACGIFNIKLMKCGGIRPALVIADVARSAGIDLMWGCNDESAVSIAASLHAAYACPSTRYLDLDGSFDLARDPAVGGFVVEDGYMRLLDRPGLGVEFAG
jgi:L-alanine-DL-glutamate epimerase-like enolase superfamily enzyme